MTQTQRSRLSLRPRPSGTVRDVSQEWNLRVIYMGHNIVTPRHQIVGRSRWRNTGRQDKQTQEVDRIDEDPLLHPLDRLRTGESKNPRRLPISYSGLERYYYHCLRQGRGHVPCLFRRPEVVLIGGVVIEETIRKVVVGCVGCSLEKGEILSSRVQRDLLSMTIHRPETRASKDILICSKSVVTLRRSSPVRVEVRSYSRREPRTYPRGLTRSSGQVK